MTVASLSWKNNQVDIFADFNFISDEDDDEDDDDDDEDDDDDDEDDDDG